MIHLVGDLQGCAQALDRLLAVIGFSPSRDRLTVQEVVERLAAQHGFHLGGARQRLGQVPLRHHAGMHAQPAFFDHRHALPAQPGQPMLALG